MRTCTLYLCLLLAPCCAWAQGARGAITGIVRDSSGALVPRASVTVTEEQTGQAITVLTQSDGAYLAPQLLPGMYRVAVEMSGFKHVGIGGLKVDVGTTLNQDVTLELGAVSEKVEVTGHSSLVETASGTVGTTVEVNQVLEMPLVDRNVFNLINLVPGSFNLNGTVSLGGGRSAWPMVDGINDTRGGLAAQGIEMSPPVDSMQEFKVVVNSYGAEYGRSEGGMLNAVTKSGTNRFHGSLYEFLRNDLFDARGWGADVKPPLRRNNFGASIGGPVVRNRTFFFFNYDGLRQHQGEARTNNIGLPAWRSGDFSTATRDAGGRAAAVVIYDPETGTGTFTNPLATLPFANNVIPANRLDPVAVKALKYVPAPNRTPDNPFSQAGNWQENVVNTTTLDFYTSRVDHEWTNRTRSFVRYIITAPDSMLNGYSQGFGPSDPNGIDTLNRHQNLAINTTHLFSATHFMNLTVGFNRVWLHRTTGDCCTTNWGQTLGIANVQGSTFPRINIAGGTVPFTNLGGATNADRIFAETNKDVIANFTWIRGVHSFKYGGQATRFGGNEHTSNQPSGLWTINGQYTRGIQANGAAIANTGINMADFLLGRPSAVTINSKPTIGKRIQYAAGYFQDDWRVSPRLTLNLGIRYDVETPIWEVGGRMSNFDPYAPNPLAGTGDIPKGAIGVTTFPNRNGKSQYLVNWDKNNFAPRFGFAWRVFGDAKTVVRGGFGIFFGNPYDISVVQCCNMGFVQSFTASTPVPFRMRDGIPAGALNQVPDSALTPTFGDRGTPYATATMDFIQPDRTTPYSENFNLTIQHQWRSTLFELGYLGHLGRHMDFGNTNINLIPPQLLSQTSISQRLRRPWSIFQGDTAAVMMVAPAWGMSNFHGITFKSERRFANGMGWIVSYTFTRWIDNVPLQGNTFGDAGGIQNLQNLRGERSTSPDSTPHRLVLAPIVELPFGNGKRFLNRRGVLNAVFGGWQVAVLGTLQSGGPFGATVTNGPLNLLGDQSVGLLRPNLVSSELTVADKGQPAQGVRGLQWLNAAAFAAPAPFTFGNSSRTLPGVYGPGLVNFDSMAGKNFRFGERWRVQFRWEMFNTFNTPQFGLPNTALGGGSFGVITAAGSKRIMQAGLKVYW
jgi:hypothetical protein